MPSEFGPALLWSFRGSGLQFLLRLSVNLKLCQWRQEMTSRRMWCCPLRTRKGKAMVGPGTHPGRTSVSLFVSGRVRPVCLYLPFLRAYSVSQRRLRTHINCTFCNFTNRLEKWDSGASQQDWDRAGSQWNCGWTQFCQFLAVTFSKLVLPES